ncbi:MAG: DNA recombination protein RmuC [Eubacteriales bacterium]
MDNSLIIISGFGIMIILLLVLMFKVKKSSDSGDNEKFQESIEKLKQEINAEIKSSKQETIVLLQSSMKDMGELNVSFQRQSAEQNINFQRQSSEQQDKRLISLNDQFKNFTMQSEQKLDNIRNTMENRIQSMQEENGKKLDQMRETVDEKLQKTLEERISKSFTLVSERLEQVYKGLGEMQTLAIGVGDLKKVLSNVKTRGILGEIQLGAILEEILSKEQYEENIVTKKGTGDRVEFAIKLPGDDNNPVYLPIDAKFPMEAYEKLIDAYDTGDPAAVDLAASILEKNVKGFAKTISEKYIDPPNTTDFGIMFLPIEGLYAEVVRRGMVETLQREYKISIAGPTTMAAILNSLQMGFKTLAIQKRSSEVWNVLSAVKTEFEKFGTVLAATQTRLEQAHSELDKLVGARTRKIQSKLRMISTLPDDSSVAILGIDERDEEAVEDLSEVADELKIIDEDEKED